MSIWYALWDWIPLEMLRWDFMKNALLALLLIGLTSLLLGALLCLLLTVGLRIFQQVIRFVDLVHLLRGLRVAGIQIRVIFLGKAAIRLPDLVLRCVRRHAQHLIRICSHAAHFLFVSIMLIIAPLCAGFVKHL